jgi:nitrite reductase/ring-hydroxylating ferredoxin subunit
MSSSSARWLSVELAELRDDRIVVEARGRQIVLFRAGNEIVALDNRCPHEGNPLVEGDVLGTTLVCAFHGWRFDLETGACLLGEEPVRRYPVELRGDRILVDLGPSV